MTTASSPFETSLTASVRGPEVPAAHPCQLQKPKADGNHGLLRKLRLSESGNVMAIAAAAIVPLIGMIGGAVDMSRIYLTKTRLQQACDAGALAGRKSMTGLNWSPASEAQAKELFHTNFPEGKYGTGALTADYHASSTGAVTGTATVAVPMTLMTFFGQAERDVSASCTADLQLPNTDVMLVLDTTLSMNDKNPGDAQSRIEVLRTAVTNFYTTLEGVKPAGSTIRYGFVPYSSTVNVGTLLKPEWIVDEAVYDSRVPDGTSSISGGTESADKTTTTYVVIGGTQSPGPPSTGPSENCFPPATTYTEAWSSWSAWSPDATSKPRTRKQTQTINGTTYSANLVNGVCTITSTVYNNLVREWTQTVDDNPNAGKPIPGGTAYHWIYRPVSFPMAPLKSGSVPGGSFSATVANNHANRTITWNESNACIEERATRRTDEGTGVPRYDMDVDLVPIAGNRATQWQPYLPGVVYSRKASWPTDGGTWLYTGSLPTETRSVNVNATTNYYTPFNNPQDYGACPTTSRKLNAISASTLTTYLNSLRPAGFTYHDIGFLWGLRLMSPTGLFQAEHAAAEANGRIARHLIFMTDGDTDTRIGAYDAWGISGMDRRRTPIGEIPSNATQNTITESRLSELCSVAKNQMNITVWVIAFGTTKTPLLVNCASQGRDYQANDAAELNAAFAEIASQIAELRITK